MDSLVGAIRALVVRGAPVLGAAGAFGVALAAQNATAKGGVSGRRAKSAVRSAAARLTQARPTAVNLARGVEHGVAGFEAGGAEGALTAALELAAADVATNRAIGANGRVMVKDGARIVTHCNVGSLACVGYGTALGVVRAAHEAGTRIHAWVGETRPVLQGARLTAWELDRLGVPYSVVADGAVASLMAAGEVDLVIVGADRIAANGDVANKIGTYSLAVLAAAHKVPFYVAAPVSTIDAESATGADIPIEDRDPDEVLVLGGRRLAPAGASARNPAFDVTPAKLVTAIITEHGICRAPLARSVAKVSSTVVATEA